MILLLSIFLALTQASGGVGSVAVVIVRMILYLALAGVIGWFALPRLARWVDHQPISQGLTALAVVSALLFVWAAEVIGGLAPITGAFIAGVCLARSPLRHKLETKVGTIAYGFFVPIFFVSIGLHTNAVRSAVRACCCLSCYSSLQLYRRSLVPAWALASVASLTVSRSVWVSGWFRGARSA